MLKEINIHELKPGMILGETIYNFDETISLLMNGEIISQRHIILLKNLGFESVKIEFREDGDADNTDPFGEIDMDFDKLISHVGEETVNDEPIDDDTMNMVDEVNQLNAREINFDDIKKNMRSLESSDQIIGAVPNVVNRRMPIPILTGENAKPIDVKHEQLLVETKETFEKLRYSNNLDFNHIQKMVSDILPDIIRNNDVLGRLRQLKRSDDYTFEHSIRVSILATMIGKWMGMKRAMLEELTAAAILFDIGKMKIPSFILKKPILSDEEMELMRKHSQFGYNILLKTEGVTSNIKYSALQHHERNGGVGYPLKLNEGQVNDFAKIIMVCDIFDAMTSDRPYAKKMSEFKAAEYISWQSGTTLDSKVCFIFLSNISEFFTGKYIQLSTGEVGRIIFVDPNFPTRPTVITGERVIDLIAEKDIQVVEMLDIY